MKRNTSNWSNFACFRVARVGQRQLGFLVTYAAPALNLSEMQLREVNVCWNSVFRKIFKFKQWTSVKCFIHGLGRIL